MYKAVIFFFSGTGSTWWVADRIQKQLDACGINADIVPMDSVDAKKADWWIKTADLVLFGWPVYDGDMPTPVKAFVDNLLVVEKGKHIHTFCTTTGFSADGAVRYCRRFADKGLIIDSTAHLKLPFRWYSLNPRRRQPGEKALQRIFAACEASVDGYIKALLEGKARVRGRSLMWLGALQRLPYRLVKKRRQNRLSVDEARCTHCGACAELCPAGNIRFETIPHFLGRCAQCLRCYAFCPACAIRLDKRSHGAGRPYALPDKRLGPHMLIK